nr:MBL fold metallo-hydrolase [uncultured Psychroserpens sp.]
MKYYLNLILICVCTQLFSQEQTSQLSATIIGSGSPKYNTERSGPSVLISYQDTKILVDMGNGTQANLDKIDVNFKSIDGLLFTHHHLDHNEEFVPIFIKSLLGGNAFVIAGPEPTTAFVESTLTIYEKDINYRLAKSKRTLDDVKSKFTIKELNGSEAFTIGEIKVSSVNVNHTIETVAYRFEAGGKSIVVSGDLTYSESLPVLAKNVDYLIIDSGGAVAMGSKVRTNSTRTNGSKKERAHVNLSESSLMAKEANAKHLILTHFTATTIDEEATTAELGKNYAGDISYAHDLMTIPYDENITSKLEATVSTKSLNMSTNSSKSAPSFTKMLSRMDANNDGKISKDEAKGKLKTNFDKRDKNKDGYITTDEFKGNH